jgi:hypothetical protein
MIDMKKRIPSLALLGLLLVFGACKGESPTAPPATGTLPPTGTPPPAGVTLTLTASNENPLVDSTVVITANVSQNGSAVPNGTAVEFLTNNGTFTDTNAATTIRTTTNGVATATLTASTAAATRVTATVNNVSRTVDVTFQTRPVTPPVPGTTPTIAAVTPSIGRPAGGETIRITGTNFIAPVRVLFDVGGVSPIEGFVVSRTDTAIEVITPSVNLGAGQQLTSRIIVITQAGSTNEQRAEVTEGFTFRNEALTPRVSTMSPSSGPILGGTRVSIFGDGFQAPVQVLFGDQSVPSWQEAQVVEVRFDEIVIMTPEARSTAPGGSGPVTGPVDLRVINVRSQTEVIVDNAFRYIAAMQITAAGPTEGPATGGTRVTIDGTGFVAPVAVSIGGIAAQPTFVSGTRIIAISSAVDITSCADAPGGLITVTNISNGDQAAGPLFTYRVDKPFISSISPSAVQPGGMVTITVANALPSGNRIKIGSATFLPTPVFSGTTATFTVAVPSTFTFNTEACTLGGATGTRQVPTAVDVVIDNGLVASCTDTVDDGLVINPCAVPPCPCVTPPNASITGATVCPTSTSMGTAVSAGTGTAGAIFTVTNNGGETLVLQQPAPTAQSNATFTVSGPSTTLILAPGASTSFTVSADPTVAGPFTGTIRVTSNDPDAATIDLCYNGTGT